MKREITIRLLMPIILSLSLVFLNGVAQGDVFCVDTPLKLQNALNTSATNGADDTIKIVQGNYIGNFVYNSSEMFSLTIEGGYSIGTDCGYRTDPPVNTVLDANGSGTVLQLNGSLDAIIDGITLQNGSNSGLLASLGRDFLLSNCKIQYNTGVNGGGAKLNAQNIEIINNTIILNVAKAGGGVDIQGGTNITFSGNLISQNITNYAEGGGVHIKYTNATINFINNIISENATTLYVVGGHGGGAHISNDGPINFINNTVVGNTANLACCWGGGITIYYASYANVYNNIFWGNNGQTGRDIAFYSIPESNINLLNNDIDQNPGGVSGLSNFDLSNLNKVDPSFVNLSIEDYHLQPTSPCIDSGFNGAPNLPSTDYDGLPRVVNGIVDMGAYEYQGYIAPTAPDFFGGLKEFHYYKLEERVIVKVWVTNRGTKAGEFKVAFYLSDNGVTLGQFIGESTLRRGLRAGQTSAVSSTYDSETSLSGKYFIAVIDSGDQVNEMVETNNRVIFRIP